MENEPPYGSSKRGRFMDKLFGGRERKTSEATPNSQDALDAFLHSTADRLDVTNAALPPPPPPKLAQLDTSISRYPQALAVNQQAQLNRPLAPGKHETALPPRKSSRPNKKGLTVHFSDSHPDIIGEGGEECELPVSEIRRNKVKRRPLPVSSLRSTTDASPTPSGGSRTGTAGADADFQPKPLARTQTGYSSIYEPEDHSPDSAQREEPRGRNHDANTLQIGRSATLSVTSPRRDENRRSFIEMQQAQMREAEGAAFAQAARTAHSALERGPDSGGGPKEDASDAAPLRLSTSSDTVPRRVPVEYSPAASINSNASSAYNQSNPSQGSLAAPPSALTQQNGASPFSSPLAARMASVKLRDTRDTIASPGDEALSVFVARTKHLFELFRLHAETVGPLRSRTFRECGRSGLWWFLKGRMGLELAIRGRPNSHEAQMHNEIDRQQAYSNLAKAYWLCEEVIPDIADAQRQPQDAETTAVASSLVSALRKLSQSMQRNDLLPPEEPFLPQTIDKSIWLDYPPLSHDMVALLSGNWDSGLTAMQRPMSSLQLLDALPLGDSSENFNYGRVMADAFLMEQGREAQKLYLPCILSVVRPQKQRGLVFMLASQNGSVQLAVQDDGAGPTWEDVRWRNDGCALDVRLPRGFLLSVQFSQPDFRTVRNMYDFGAKVQAMLHPQSDEKVLFRNTLRSFQYLESEPPTRAFPKEPVSRCEVALMEKVYKENGPVGRRCWHCGFRIAVNTGPRTRSVNGVQHGFPPALPVQFGFFRAEGDAPALSVKYESGRHSGRMVFVFNDEKERVAFHSLLAGTALNHDEKVTAEVSLKTFMIAQSLREPLGLAPFSRMAWRAARVINSESGGGGGGEQPATVLADKLKLVLEYRDGAVTDRINVAPGELRIRLEVSNAKVLRVMRQPQKDMTLSVSEAQASKELPRSLTDAQQLLMSNQTIRSYEFSHLTDLHVFQAAVTGFEVRFDGLAATFAISRRRMVVPIHKKWEAGFTRIQVVRLEDRQLQLLAFFEDFHHGHCINFVLKGTDVYETFHRSGRSGIKFVDAKFPLPRVQADKDGDFDDVAFVCLDLPDLPGEHDDITIMFEKESDRDRLCECLPAPVKGSSRISSRMK
ncbi:hypothetical protein XA68_13867 [Ophiocordyceps unilateralis]|uniref:Uncharacterized protein n=1 Tax=Ophiocordyceps unilateralis TaxID=268505 RepID=A0A2A9PAV8_OPHUN|nr:hypothetical protein XA68_13867 [Ophiocordyceps unilateralis]